MIFTTLVHAYPVHIVGVGGIGSKVAECILRGDCGTVPQLHVWDGDTVESHNLRNQAYILEDVDHPKVFALTQRAKAWGGAVPHVHNEFITGAVPLSGIVILCLDSMSARKTVWDTCIKQNPNVRLMIETRMDALRGVIYTVDPNNELHVAEWEKYWFPDDEGHNEGAGCGLNPTLGTTALKVAGEVGWQLIRFSSIEQGGDDVLYNRIVMNQRPLSVEGYKWE